MDCKSCDRVPGRRECLYGCEGRLEGYEEDLEVTGDKDVVLKAFRLLLSHCDGAVSKDGEGFDIFDAGTMRFFSFPEMFGNDEISDEEGEFIRLKLIRYREQLKKYGFEEVDKLYEPVSKTWFFARAEDEDGRRLRVSRRSFEEPPEEPVRLKTLRVEEV